MKPRGVRQYIGHQYELKGEEARAEAVTRRRAERSACFKLTTLRGEEGSVLECRFSVVQVRAATGGFFALSPEAAELWQCRQGGW